MQTKKYQGLFIILCLGLLFHPLMAQQTSLAFLDKLKKSNYRVVLADGTTASTASALVTRQWNNDRCRLAVKNTSSAPLVVREVIVFDFQHSLSGKTPIYGEGFQKLAQTGGTLAQPEDWGWPGSKPGSHYSDREHYKIPEPEQMRTAYGMLTLQLSENDRVLLATTSCHRFISRFSFDAQRLRISMDAEGLTLRPGEEWNLEEFLAISGNDREKLYDQLAAAIAVHHPKLEHPSVPVGWCSWYCFGPSVTEKNVADNTEWIAKNLPDLRYIQIDDGYQPFMGDWLEAGKAFGGGVQNVLKEIADKKLEPAIWVAPFIASPESKLFKEHPDWMVKDEQGQPLRSDKVGFGGWRQAPWYVLDGTHPEVQKFLTHVFKTMREQWHCTYFKLDANYWGAIHGGVHYDKNATRIEAYRRGMDAIKKGAGDAFLLGCNHPIWASLGLIHGSRSSMDADRKWFSFKQVGRENLLRGWQNGRFWWNDPDCLLLADANPFDEPQEALQHPSEQEYIYHATTLYASGGMLLSGDDMTKIPPGRLALLKKLIPPTGKAARFENEHLEIGTTTLDDRTVYSVFNASDTATARTITLPAGKYSLVDKWTGKNLGIHEKTYHIPSLPPHSARLIEAKKK